jgi:hypothetical protein
MMQLIFLFTIMTSVFSAPESYTILKAGANAGQAGAHAEAGAYRYNDPDSGVFASGPAAGVGGNIFYAIMVQLLLFLSSKSWM